MKLKKKNFKFNSILDSNFYKISEDTWYFLFKIYGGGPELIANNSANSLNGSKSSSPSSPPKISYSSLKVEETQL